MQVTSAHSRELFGGDPDAPLQVVRVGYTGDPVAVVITGDGLSAAGEFVVCADGVLEVPVRVEVEGSARIGVMVDTIDFGSSFIGYGTTRDLAVENTGTATLSIQDIVTPEAQFNAAQTSYNIPVFDEAKIPITVAPDAEGVITGSLIITSNATNAPALIVPMRGTGLWRIAAL